jgi:hypothetical protein
MMTAVTNGSGVPDYKKDAAARRGDRADLPGAKTAAELAALGCAERAQIDEPVRSSKAAHIAVGVDMDGIKRVLGIWLQTEATWHQRPCRPAW